MGKVATRLYALLQTQACLNGQPCKWAAGEGSSELLSKAKEVGGWVGGWVGGSEVRGCQRRRVWVAGGRGWLGPGCRTAAPTRLQSVDADAAAATEPEQPTACSA